MSYATDGRCHNAEPGTFGHECGKPATWIGTKKQAPEAHPAPAFRSGFCDDCKANGYEAKQFSQWERVEPPSSQVMGDQGGDGDPKPGDVGDD